MDESNSPQSDYLLPGRVYDILKWLALIALPAVAWLVGAVGPQWGLPHCGELVTTINAIGLFVGLDRRETRTRPSLSFYAGGGAFFIFRWKAARFDHIDTISTR